MPQDTRIHRRAEWDVATVTVAGVDGVMPAFPRHARHLLWDCHDYDAILRIMSYASH